MTLAALRRFAPADRVNRLWQETWRGAATSPLACAACAGPMLRATIAVGGGVLELDVCKPCQSIWFDAGELAALSPERQSPPEGPTLPEEARRALGVAMTEEISRDARDRRREEGIGRVLSGRRAGRWLIDALLGL